MRISKLLALVGLAFLAAGCAGPEKKLGRGLLNVTEFARGGEIRRSMEQTYLWENSDSAYTTGFIRGFNRSVARTAIGIYEVVTFPFPSYRSSADLDGSDLSGSQHAQPNVSLRRHGPDRVSDLPGQLPPRHHCRFDFSRPTRRSASAAATSRLMFHGSRFRIFDN